jgi:hypothetical protein
MARRRWQCLRGDSGAVLPEFGLMLPLIAVLALGVVEYGMAYQEGNNLERTVAYAGRVAGTSGTEKFSDYDILQAINSGLLGQDRLTLKKVIVYESTTSDGAPPVGCTTINPTGFGSFGVGGQCNVYSAQQVATQDPGVGFARSQSGGDFSCAGGSWDSNWCFSSRDPSLTSGGSGVDRIGVLVEVEYDGLTGLIPGTNMTMTRRAVFELEPIVEV